MSNFFVNRSEASVSYDSKIVLCSNGLIELKKYKKSISRLKPGFEESKDSSFVPSFQKCKKDSSYNVILSRNLARSRNLIIHYASENEHLFHSFITLTFNDNQKFEFNTDIDINDISQANKIFNVWRTQIKRKFKDFSYICVPEYQKRGAIHYHLLTSLKCGSDIPKLQIKRTFNTEKKRYFDLEYYNIPFWIYGYSSAFDIHNTDDNFNIALYITKYLFKDIDNRLYGHQKVMKSNNLKKPLTIFTNNKTYDDAMSYIKEKGYDINSYSFVPTEKYQIAFDKSDTRVLQDDYMLLSDTFANEYQER